MVERGRGSIVTMASTAARHAGGDPIGAPTGYAVAKAGVVRLTQEVAKEVARHGVRVNCVSPSTILTERVEAMMPAERGAQLTAMHPLGRLGRPEDVAYAVLFLASEWSSWITGVTSTCRRTDHDLTVDVGPARAGRANPALAPRPRPVPG